MILLALDPGTTHTGYVKYDMAAHAVLESAKLPNAQLLSELAVSRTGEHLVCEMFANQGGNVGGETFEAAVWLGRFIEAWVERTKKTYSLITRQSVKSVLARAYVEYADEEEQDRVIALSSADSKVRAQIISMFPGTGGGSIPAVGTKALPGPLYGMANDMWAALGVALAYVCLSVNEGASSQFVRIGKKFKQRKNWPASNTRLLAEGLTDAQVDKQ